jgi:hypothetical protein
MKPFHVIKETGDKNYQALEEFLDLMIWTFDIAAGCCPLFCTRTT